MADLTLCDFILDRFGLTIDQDSDGGQILSSLTLQQLPDRQLLTGQAAISSLTFALTSKGVSVRAASAIDALVFSLPPQTLTYTLVPPKDEQPLRVESILTPLSVTAVLAD